MPHDLVTAKPVMARIRGFFGSAVSQFHGQTNPGCQRNHTQAAVGSALGPGGSSSLRNSAGFDVRERFTPRTTAAICLSNTGRPEHRPHQARSRLPLRGINELRLHRVAYRRVTGRLIIDYVPSLTPATVNSKPAKSFEKDNVEELNEELSARQSPSTSRTASTCLAGRDKIRRGRGSQRFSR